MFSPFPKKGTVLKMFYSFTAKKLKYSDLLPFLTAKNAKNARAAKNFALIEAALAFFAFFAVKIL
jgi:hypothetical protein